MYLIITSRVRLPIVPNSGRIDRQVGEVRDHGRRLKTHLFTCYDSAHKAQ